jgi:hypothetical protein
MFSNGILLTVAPSERKLKPKAKGRSLLQHSLLICILLCFKVEIKKITRNAKALGNGEGHKHCLQALSLDSLKTLRKQMDFTRVSGKLSEWQRSAMTMSSVDLLANLMSEWVFLFLILEGSIIN